MLGGLESIDWRSLTHAYGPADDVPEALRALAEGRASAEDVAGVFWGNIWHQGTVYEATAYAVPFLIELLGSGRIKDREWLLLLLNSLATGSSYRAVHGNASSREDPREFEGARERELDWVRQAHEAVGDGIPSYLNLLQNTSPNVRTAAALVLSCFPERAELTLPRLRQRLHGEPRRDVQASILLCLGALRDSEASTSKALAEAARRRRDDPRRLAAALSLLWRDKDEAPPAAIRVVQDVLIAPETFPEAYVFSAWDVDADPGQTLYEALLLLGQEKAIPALLDVLDRSEEPADILIDFLIEAAFSEHRGAAVEPGRLTPFQKDVLLSFLGLGAFWDEAGKWKTHSIGSAEWQIGLPQTRREIEQLLEKE